MKKIFIVILLGILTINSFSQIAKPVKWKFEHKSMGPTQTELIFTAQIENKWHIYGLNLPKNGPISTTFHFTQLIGVKLNGDIQPQAKPEIKNDPGFGIEVSLYSGKVSFIQQLKLIGKTPVIKGYVEYMSCNDLNCLPPAREEFEIAISQSSNKLAENVQNSLQSGITTKTLNDSIHDNSPTHKELLSQNRVNAEKPVASQSWFVFLLVAFLAGLAGVLTPCVFPMIPMTVSFFMNTGKNRVNTIFKALVFGLSLVLIYTLIGGLVSLIGSGFVDFLTKHWIPNLLFFLLFVGFSLSFLGWYEIILPGTLVNKADQQVEKGGILASFFMALTTTLVSFSCTGPIVGSLLVEGASGHVLRPVFGMLSFGVGFALPFTILALFPSWLKNLPKSGGWMNAVKVILGLIMLAFSLKFIMNIDQTHHLGILTREVYLVIWMVIAVVMGLYLLGKIRMTHDSETKTIGTGRLLLAIVAFSFAGYLLTGLLGSPLQNISSFLPPQERNRILAPEKNTGAVSIELCSAPKYSDFLELPFNLNGYFDYKQGMECAHQLNKPVLLDFKGHTCSNCKKMENSVWSNPDILQQLNNEFVIIALYTDDYTELPKNEWVQSVFDNKLKKTIGEINADFQTTHFKTNTLPMYVIVDNNGNTIAKPVGYDPDVKKFGDFLKTGVQTFSKTK